MSIEDTLLDHLRLLAEQSAWLLSELPQQITDPVLLCLDDRGWIELQVWELRQRGGPTKVTGTFSPSRSPLAAGDWDMIVRTYRYGERKRPDMYCELRVSAKGKARLAEAELVTPPKPEPADTQDQRPPARNSPDKKPVKQLPKEAFDAYRAVVVAGQTQAPTAELLSKKYRRPIPQGTVSRWLKEVETFRKCGGVMPPIEASRPTVRPVDPSDLDMGKRTDPRKPRPQDFRRSEEYDAAD